MGQSAEPRVTTQTFAELPNSMNSATSKRSIYLWMLKGPVGLLFLVAGMAKLVGVPASVEMFASIGLGQGFRYFTGLVEVACALLLFVPGMAYYAATLLAAVMIGAIAIQRTVLGGSLVPPAVLLVLLILIAWFSRAGRRA